MKIGLYLQSILVLGRLWCLCSFKGPLTLRLFSARLMTMTGKFVLPIGWQSQSTNRLSEFNNVKFRCFYVFFFVDQSVFPVFCLSRRLTFFRLFPNRSEDRERHRFLFRSRLVFYSSDLLSDGVPGWCFIRRLYFRMVFPVVRLFQFTGRKSDFGSGSVGGSWTFSDSVS